jgi:hypothetical protein
MKQGGRNMSKEREKRNTRVRKSYQSWTETTTDLERFGFACRERRAESGDDGSVYSSVWVRQRERARKQNLGSRERGWGRVREREGEGARLKKQRTGVRTSEEERACVRGYVEVQMNCMQGSKCHSINRRQHATNCSAATTHHKTSP